MASKTKKPVSDFLRFLRALSKRPYLVSVQSAYFEINFSYKNKELFSFKYHDHKPYVIFADSASWYYLNREEYLQLHSLVAAAAIKPDFINKTAIDRLFDQIS